MRYSVDLSLFAQTMHTPSLFSLERSMGTIGELRDYCIPVNSYFPPLELFEVIRQKLTRTLRYYPSSNERISELVGNCFGLDPHNVVVFNGATELLTWLNRLFVNDPIIVPTPTFGRWTDVPTASDRRVIHCTRREQDDYRIDPYDLVRLARKHSAQSVVLCNPNNPTGAILSQGEIYHLLHKLRNLELIVIDESFVDFSDRPECHSIAARVHEFENVVVMKSLGKNLGLHGMRLGYSISNPNLARRIRCQIPHWNVNSVAEQVLELLPHFLDDYRTSLTHVVQDRQRLDRLLRTLPGVKVFPSQANFVFCQFPHHCDGNLLRNELLTENGFLTRHCGNKIGSTSNHFRIVARPENDILELIDALMIALRL